MQKNLFVGVAQADLQTGPCQQAWSQAAALQDDVKGSHTATLRGVWTPGGCVDPWGGGLSAVALWGSWT